MGYCNFRSLLLAAIVLCNCISWTASRHHFSHNARSLVHRTRHRRQQGTGLFLSSSYVLPGGEGTGAWGPWGDVSPCSRTCGGGVASQKRICLEVGSDGRSLCSGGDTKYFSCQTQDCHDHGDYRAQQCAEFNDVPFKGTRHDWVPYTKAPNPCELNCMPRGGRFYYRQKERVVDGTRCNEDSFDVCVVGTCQPVGCDFMLGSYAREDKCRECRGNGTNCHTVSGKIDSQELRQGMIELECPFIGYNDVLLIPQGATSIYISESRTSNNYLALRSKVTNQYYLNGDYQIDFPRTRQIAGALWRYDRSTDGLPSPDKLKCLGPTTEPLYLSLLLQDVNVGIDYEYSVPTALAPPPNQEYNWVFDEFTPCTATCGGGYQTRNVTCRSREDLDLVDESLCDVGLKPAVNQTCATQSCAARWVEGPWSPCSKPCGQGGSRSRQVHCEKIITNGYPSIVDDQECFNLLGPKPNLYEECNVNASCPSWFTGPWKPCDKLCDEGKQTRQVVCHQRLGSKVEVLPEAQCTDEKPETEKACFLHPCEGVDWVISDWTGCDTCLSKVRTRRAECATKDHKVVNSSLCSYHPLPPLEEECDKTKLPTCDVQWYATQWSKCSVTCGSGVQNRRVFCGIFDGASVVKVDDERCDNETKYKDTKTCEVPEDKCPAKWFASPWTECNRDCGGGEQFRRVMCLSSGKEVSGCDEDAILDSMQACNVGPCDKDETLPVDSSSTPIMDDYDEEECPEEEEEPGDLEEEAEEVEGGVTSDLMFSDSPYTEFTEGSGDSTVMIDARLGGEGSGEEPSTEETSSTESAGTTETMEESTESSTGETGSTESSATGSTEISETGSTETSGTGSTEVSGTEPTEVSGSETTEGTETGSTEATGTESSSASESSSEGSTETSVAASESSAGTDASSTESSSESSASPTDSSTTESETESSTTESSTDISTTESASSSDSTTLFEASFASTEETGSTETSVAGSGITETGETEATGSTESSGTDETGSTESGATEETGTTESGATEETGTTESGATEETVTTESGATEETGSTESGATEETGSTESGATEETGTTESGATEETATTESGATEETGSTETEGTSETTPWDWSTTIEEVTKRSRCKLRKKASKCVKSKFGCCPDKRTPAAGPFDEGCPNPKTCKDSKFGCCPDGVSPAGPKGRDCPVAPCNETLFGCCKSDNKTAAEGNDQDGCPPPPPKCKSSKFGCCKDRKTEAKGLKRKGCPENEPPKKPEGCAGSKFGCCHDNETAATAAAGAGCPCAATQFGCCPDGAATATGAHMEGCVMSCNTSAYGCCADGETPAHGPEQEGCCLQYRFGCCPDNYNPAEGPHLEGCGCQHSHFGCCPDNVTIARGTNKEGCGCQYTEHGCCPDRHTEAAGSNYEGCGCHTYQFGCCPDGLTIAKGPNLQGCLCSQSTHGCCSDGVTAAKGPEFEGCDCSSSKYGCCPDGQTEAKGDKFLGCTDVPENRQAGCSLTLDRGPCRNYTVKWYYDLEYGGCSRFWYGGCEGNGNRFGSQDECEDVCVKPGPKDACNLPKVKGACQGYHLRWYYDSSRETCGQFVFGGCLGNANNFETKDTCQEQCEPAKSENQCKLPIERGSCAGNFSRWGFSADTGRCEQFIWGGCEGNANRFGSEAACVQRCDPPGALKPACTLPQVTGNCTEKEARWSFSQTENRCVPFYYTGCHGNENNFQTEAECADSCPSAYVKDSCTLPAETGDCADYRQRWYYDTAEQRCRQFYYGGCGGNNNNFVTEQECEQRCQHAPATTPAPAAPEPFRTEFCFLEKERGPCHQPESRWAYDPAAGACVAFEYGGCGGNRNNFPSLEYCNHFCQTVQDVCQLPMSAGPCNDSLQRWFYDAASDSCSQFAYGGCGGNENKFESPEACERRCRGGPQEPVPTTPTTTTTTTVLPEINNRVPETDQELAPECQASPYLEECVEEGRVWFFDQTRGECAPHDNPSSGGLRCRRTGVFASEEACERSCGRFVDTDVCRYSVDAGPCNERVAKVYFDVSQGRCLPFTYGGCEGGPNRFSSFQECEETCRVQPTTDPCRQHADQGPCREYFIKWYYDEARDSCAQFVYGGCSGNENRFDTRELCEGQCSRRATTPAPAPPVATPAAEVVSAECQTPESLSPCGRNSSVYYYDTERRECREAQFGECRHANSWRTVEECERRCGSFRGFDVCRQNMDPGSCNQGLEKYYFDGATGTCRQFTFGGCLGGANRFSTFDECEEVCLGAAPAPEDLDTGNEVLPDCDAYNAECGRLRCLHGITRTRTDGGCERCACAPGGGNCDAYTAECADLSCPYGLIRTAQPDGCERCSCLDHPCAGRDCPYGERCVAEAFRDPVTQEPRYNASCRTMNKPGYCPSEESSQFPEEQCRRECNDDADCRGANKCCQRGCAMLCLGGSAPATAAPTPAMELPQAPQASAETEPAVTSSEGGRATLRCLFHSNPPPRITWRRGELTIEGDVGRYRLLSDGALEIVSVYRNDSGVYICIADNGLGSARQEVRLQVNDPEELPAGIAGEAGAEVVGELGRPLSVRCLAFGYPAPTIAWYYGHTGPMVPYIHDLYEVRNNILLIRSLDLNTIGIYTCQAFNGIGKPASWSVAVKAFRPEGNFYESPYLLDRENEVRVTPKSPYIEPTPPAQEPEVQTSYTVPVRTRLVVPGPLQTGGELSLPCEVSGHPPPAVSWSKDGQRLEQDDRIFLSEARLTISRLSTTDSGVYGCHASNEYGSHNSSVQINVEGSDIPTSCSDNPFFAKCSLIVRSKFCHHLYYSQFCCKSCVESGQLRLEELPALQARWARK